MKQEIISNSSEIEEIIKKSKVCYISLCDKDTPYGLPMNFGYGNNTIYLHTNGCGTKDKIININNKVHICFSVNEQLYWVNEDVACSYSMIFKSVMVKGNIIKVESNEEKIIAFNHIMKQYTEGNFTYSKPSLDNVTVYKVDIKEMTGRKRGY